MPSVSPSVRVQQLFIYPVKSLAGIKVEQWPATPTGFKHDRQFMLINAQGTFITQRHLPKMVLITTAVSQSGADAQLTLSTEGAADISLSLNNHSDETCPAAFSASIWEDEVQVFEPAAEVSAWLSQVLNTSVRLVALAERRPQSQPQRFGASSHTVFADAAPYLIANQNSLEQLNRELSEHSQTQVDIRRFRPNIVISGELPAFAEHDFCNLQKLSNPGDELDKGYQLSLVDHCQRCILTTVDPDTGIKDAAIEPFRTLSRINPMPDPEQARPKPLPAFAVNGLLIGEQVCDVSVGDRLIIS